MAAPGGGGSSGQEGGKGSRAGLRGAGIPPPPPLSAARSRSSGPSLSRRCPGPFHPPIKLFFFFFKLPGRTRAGQWAAGNEGQTAAGAAGGPMGARAGPGAGPAATGRALWGGRARRIGAEGGEGRAPAAGRWEEGRTQRAGDSVGPPRGSAR